MADEVQSQLGLKSQQSDMSVGYMAYSNDKNKSNIFKTADDNSIIVCKSTASPDMHGHSYSNSKSEINSVTPTKRYTMTSTKKHGQKNRHG